MLDQCWNNADVCDYLHSKRSFHNDGTFDVAETCDRSVSFRRFTSYLGKMLYPIRPSFIPCHVFYERHVVPFLSLSFFVLFKMCFVGLSHTYMKIEKRLTLRFDSHTSHLRALSPTRIADAYVQSHLPRAATERRDLERGFNTDSIPFSSTYSTNSVPVSPLGAVIHTVIYSGLSLSLLAARKFLVLIRFVSLVRQKSILHPEKRGWLTPFVTLRRSDANTFRGITAAGICCIT